MTKQTYVKFNIHVRQGTKQMLDNYNCECETNTYHCAYCLDSSTMYITDYCKLQIMMYQENIDTDYLKSMLTKHARLHLQELANTGYRDGLLREQGTDTLLAISTVDHVHLSDDSTVADYILKRTK